MGRAGGVDMERQNINNPFLTGFGGGVVSFLGLVPYMDGSYPIPTHFTYRGNHEHIRVEG